MDATQIRQLKPMLSTFLKRFDDCFARQDTGRICLCTLKGNCRTLSVRAWSRSPRRLVWRRGPCRSSRAF